MRSQADVVIQEAYGVHVWAKPGKTAIPRGRGPDRLAVSDHVHTGGSDSLRDEGRREGCIIDHDHLN
jgi:hypothetical protein